MPLQPPPDFIIGGFKYPGAKLAYGNIEIGCSVDADDGAIDGSGSNGWSISAVPYIQIGNEDIVYNLEIDFDAQKLGFLPTAVGMVLTTPATGFSVYDAAGNREDFLTNNLVFSSDPNVTSDDRFIGAINPDGISKITIGARLSYSSAEQVATIDHLQYGLLVPEPATWPLLAAGCLSLFPFRRRWKESVQAT